MNSRSNPVVVAVLAAGMLVGCQVPRRPTLEETRLGQASSYPPDATLRPGEVRAEVDQIDPARREIRLRSEGGRALIYRYDDASRVIYQGREYGVANLEAGDVVIIDPRATGSYLASIRVEETVQDRLGRGTARRAPPRAEVIEGTVEAIDRERGVFDLRLRSGKTVTVTLPYNARPADVEDFRSLRRGDAVRVEGDFIAPDAFQMQALLSGARARR